MSIHHIIKSAVLVAAIIITGCSKSPSQKREFIAPKGTKDLGAFELQAEAPTNFRLGQDRSCTIVARQVGKNDMQLRVDFYSTNTDGTIDHKGWEDNTVQGQEMSYRVWGMTVFMKPTVKKP